MVIFLVLSSIINYTVLRNDESRQHIDTFLFTLFFYKIYKCTRFRGPSTRAGFDNEENWKNSLVLVKKNIDLKEGEYYTKDIFYGRICIIKEIKNKLYYH